MFIPTKSITNLHRVLKVSHIIPLVTDPLYLVYMAKNSFLKNKGSRIKFRMSAASMSR